MMVWSIPMIIITGMATIMTTIIPMTMITHKTMITDIPMKESWR
jgi:hypothetical protein